MRKKELASKFNFGIGDFKCVFERATYLFERKKS
jgi:hypothetical protein